MKLTLCSYQGKNFNLVQDCPDLALSSYAQEDISIPFYREKCELLYQIVRKNQNSVKLIHAHFDKIDGKPISWNTTRALPHDELIIIDQYQYRWFIEVGKERVLAYLGSKWGELIHDHNLPTLSTVRETILFEFTDSEQISPVIAAPISLTEVVRIDRLQAQAVESQNGMNKVVASGSLTGHDLNLENIRKFICQ